MPTSEFDKADFENGKNLVELLNEIGIIKSNSEGRRLIQQNGISVNDEKVKDFAQVLTLDDFTDGALIVKKGKKVFHKIKIK